MMKSDNCAIQFSNPNVGKLGEFIVSAAERKLPLVRHNQHADLYGAVICGSGPSLLSARTLKAIRAKMRNPKWKIIACKESIRFLRERNIRVDYSVSMDPGANQTEKTHLDKEITYCLASSCNPVLYDWVLNAGCRVQVFHSACGWPNEVVLYKQAFEYARQQRKCSDPKCGCGPADTVVGGFTVLNRALGLAEYMGFRNIMFCGAQLGWREDQTYYAKGAKGKHLVDVTMTDNGRIDGKPWWTRPDMLASAVAIAYLKKQRGDRIQIIGDSLAASLAKKTDAELADVAQVKKAMSAARPAPQKPAESAQVT